LAASWWRRAGARNDTPLLNQRVLPGRWKTEQNEPIRRTQLATIVSIFILNVMALTPKALCINNQWIANATMWYKLAHAF
jgi:hypothetical protein